ncbi:Bacteriorhodopsin [Halorubrum xinjiangense]|uniref:Bacteriorhodopsin n=1 Tax=Halorubrum xinjiangense TaxID=261291 RepID=A0A1G7RTB7_9EURY|nr:bacteriorhodopsin [Halorubrum xinjiangense]SDG13981.1 Bacteriorhodopsin [Halorubrum xinjiangense]
MIEPSAVRFASAAIYAVSAVVLLALARRKPPELRRYCYPFAAVVAFAGIGVGLWGAGIGAFSVASGTLEGGQLLTDYVAYPFLFGFAAFVAGASRRYVAGVVAITVAMRLGYDFAEVFEGALATAGTLGILVGYATLLGLFFGPVASAAARQPPERELFYKKTRNLALFAFGVLIAWAMLQIAGLFDQFTATVTLEYLDLLLRVGFAGFVFANVETLAAEAEAGVGEEGGDPGTAATVSVSSAD